MILGMMTHELEVSILAAPLAQMDRGALSQAWYTALRLAPNARLAAAGCTHAQMGPVSAAHHRLGETLKTVEPARCASAITISPSHRNAPAFNEVQGAAGRARSRALAVRIERAFAGLPMRAKRATFSLGRGNARVHIILQTIGERPTLLALCRPEAKTVVMRALAHARLSARWTWYRARPMRLWRTLMFLNPSLSGALDRIAERAADVRRAYTPGALPQHDDVATASSLSDFTLDPLSVVAPDSAYFVASDDRGENLYTRDGAFALRDGTLVDQGGHAVLGRITLGGALAPLRVERVDQALGRVDAPAVEADGSFVYYRSVVDPRSAKRDTQRVVAGHLALARFPAGTRLESVDGSFGRAAAGVTPQLGSPGDGDFGALTPMRRERSRIDVDESLARLKEAYIAFDALQAAEMARAHLGKTAMDLLK